MSAQRSIRQEYLQRYGLIVSFLVLCLALTLLSDRFLTLNNIVNVLRQSTICGIIAVGMTYVILTAGIDLSVGAILAPKCTCFYLLVRLRITPSMRARRNELFPLP